MLESRVCVIKGQLPRALGNLGQDRQVLFDKIAPWMVLKLRCQELIARCSEAAMENGMRTMSLDQERALDIILRTYEGQVNDLALQAVTGTSLPHKSIPNSHPNMQTDDERFDTALCRMAIHSLHFYKSQTLTTSGCYPRVLVTACNLIDYIQSLNDRLGCIAMAPIQIGFGLLLASTALLRILKSNAASQGLETSRARASLFTAINLAKQMSIDNADLAAKTVTVLNCVWNSHKAFRKIDGSEYTVLRIRSRLVLSPILDTVWWWRDEFDPQSRTVRSVVEPAEGIVLSFLACVTWSVLMQGQGLGLRLIEMLGVGLRVALGVLESGMMRFISMSSFWRILNGRWGMMRCFLSIRCRSVGLRQIICCELGRLGRYCGRSFGDIWTIRWSPRGV